jgi:hypothetical protein
MAEPLTDPHLYTDCLAAMAVSGEVYPCETLAPVLPADSAFPAAPPDHQAAAPRRTERT